MSGSDSSRLRISQCLNRSQGSGYLSKLIAGEISTITKYYDRLVQLAPLESDNFEIYDSIECPNKEICGCFEDLTDFSGEQSKRTAFLLNGNFNYSNDIEGVLKQIYPKLSRTSRIIAVAYNPYLAGLYKLATWLGLRKAPLPTTFLTTTTLNHICKLAGFEVLRARPVAFCPFRLLGVGRFFNWLLPAIPLVNYLAISCVISIRPIKAVAKAKKLSIIIPARNEKGNIETAIVKLIDCKLNCEVIFIEGHSQDGTWSEILRVKEQYGSDRFWIKTFQQSGRGKNDAVRLGFSKATGELLTILDADLTVPPKLLKRFYQAWHAGHADFINGSRLLYPMEGAAMRTLNLFGNVFFAKAISFVCGMKLSDTLCGTKLLEKHDWERLCKWRKDFGEFDPFGDFELIFGASVLSLGCVNIPIHYRARVYGETNISRFRHGWMLLRMTIIGFFRIRMGRWL